MKTKILLIWLVLCLPFLAGAQYVLNEADVQYELYNYDKAINLYEQAYKKKATLHAAERLGKCYTSQKKYIQAESWYAITANISGSPALNTLYYAEALRSNSKYGEAIVQYKKYTELDKNVSLVLQTNFLASCDSAITWMRNPLAVSLANEKRLNSPESDFAAVQQHGVVVFTSDRGIAARLKNETKRSFLKLDGTKFPDRNIYGWTGNHYLRLYTTNQNDSIGLFPVNAGTDYHVGTASFSADGNEMYFTLTKIADDLDYVKVKNISGKLGTVNVGIYSCKKDTAGLWESPKAFAYNLKYASFGDPFVTADGNSLYFSSDMPGGKGGTDLYVSQKTDAGHWGIPINLQEINTEGNERSPFFDGRNHFYFSTDGRTGMGGLDIFCAKLLGGKITDPVNLRYPFNSPQDDFAYSVHGTSGFLSSNRLGGVGDDDIYSFSFRKELAFKLIGQVLDRDTHIPLASAMITLTGNNGNSLKVETDADGTFSFKLDRDEDYRLTGNKTSYLSDTGILSTRNLEVSAILHKNLYLMKIELEKVIRLENIYYDFDQAEIRTDAKPELDKLVKLMQDNPSIWIELGSHTDSRGNDAYNLDLSQRRANSALQYMIKHGIDQNRIEARGYGESKPVNQCINGIKCSETDYQLNRRTEFKIVKK